MKSRLLVVLVMALYCFPIYALHITYRYDTSTLSFAKDTTEYGVFEKVVWDDECLYAHTDVGTPALPVFHHIVNIEENIVVDSIKVNPLNGHYGTLVHPIMPCQHPIPTSLSAYKMPFAIKNSIYQTNDIFPKKCLVNHRIDYDREGKFLSLDIIPFQYNPITKEYIVYSMVDVEIFIHKDEIRDRSIQTSVDIGIPFYEYVIITSAQLMSAFEPFAAWKRAKGYEVGIVNINDILSNPSLAQGDDISGLSDNAGKLRKYLTYSYNMIGTKYVLFGGDASTIPIRYALDSVPSDFYYADLNSNWDTNNNGIYGEIDDNVDYGAEIYVGRLLCNSLEEVKNWTKKVLQYEINPGNGDYSYLTRALFSQQDFMQKKGDAERVQQKLQGHIYCTIFSEYPSYNAPNPSFPTGSIIIDSINTIHYGLLGNHNHGGPLVYGVASHKDKEEASENKGVFAMDSYDELFPTNDEYGNGFDNLTNELYPSIMYSTSCENMPFDQFKTPSGTYNLGRVFTCRSKGGGPAYIGNTRFGYAESSSILNCQFLDLVLCNARDNHIGIAEAKSKFQYKHNYLRHSHNLLGCPEMSLYTRIPSTFDNININTTGGQMVISTGISDSTDSRICLSGDIDGVYRQFVYTDRSNVTFDTIPDTYTLVVSMPNYIPYILTNDTCFLQNSIITGNKTYTGCNVFYIGSDIISIQPYGEVTIGSGSSVIIDVEDEVTIKNDFQVQHGGQLLIR